METKPLLSIGIIFKNNIRSIERCLKALHPLREAVPCELVMADTGSDDGSRAVAEEYADILFQFPWIDDFAAARNAVIDHCSGDWYLSVDTDEYLDEDISELLDFLRTADPSKNLGQVNIRNYKSYEMDGVYSDFYTLRLVRLSTGARFKGAIHESWAGVEHKGPAAQLSNTIFHHDGYVNMGQNTEKLKRNMTLLRQKLKTDPQNLLVRVQIIESGLQEKDYEEQLRKAVALVKRKPAGWEVFGPPILRYGVVIAKDRKMPELSKWIKLAQEWFPDSYYTRIDINAQCMMESYEANDYAASVRQGEALMQAYADFRAGRGDINCQMYSTLRLSSPYHEQLFRLMFAVSCLEEDRLEQARTLLEQVDYSMLDGSLTNNLAKALCSLRSRSNLDTEKLILAAWEGINTPKPSEKRAEERRLTFMLIGSSAFTPDYRNKEIQKAQRHAYTLFTPLAGKCGLGTAAAILESNDQGEIQALLSGVEKWNELPFPAVSHAIKHGVPFPLPDKPLDIEAMDALAKRLAGDWGTLFSLVEAAMKKGTGLSWQEVAWTQAMTLAAVRGCGWRNTEQGITLARAFARAEQEFNSRCYSLETLCEEHIFALPSVHRFGWHCVQSFSALDSGRLADCVHHLRAGLSTCQEMKTMVEFLLDHTPELQAPPPSAELLALAEKVRMLLVAYDPGDPIVESLKQSPAYQKVAYLLEGLEAPVMGGLAQ